MFSSGIGSGLVGADKVLEEVMSLKMMLPPKKTRHECDASSITSNCRGALFKCGEWSVTRKKGVLCSLNNRQKAKNIVDLVKTYAGEMLALNQINKSSEKKYVQPAVRNTLWPILRRQLACGAQLLLENERKFNLHVENERDEADVAGLTDHCLKIVDSDARLATWEDKSICKQWSVQDVAQAQAEMMIECQEIEEFFSVVPTEYCGILQNGCTWTFLFRTINRGKIVWSYVRTPATFENGAVSEESCSVVAKFLEHVLVIVDRLYDEIVLPKMIIRSMVLASKPEGKVDHGEGKQDDSFDPTGGPGQAPPRQRGGAQSRQRGGAQSRPRRGAQSSSGDTAGKTKKHNPNDCALKDADKENLFLPLTAWHVNKLPIQSVRVFY